MDLLFGYQVVESVYVPRCRYSGPVILRQGITTDQFWEEFNDWAIALFGGKKEDEIYVSEIGRVIYIHPQTAHKLRALIRSKGTA